MATGAPRRVGIVGTGVIGASWAARFLAAGSDVVAYDPGPDSDTFTRRAVDDFWPLLTRMGLAADASPDRLTFATTVADCVVEADFVQESGPERLDVKATLLAQVDTHAPERTVIASSSSGLLPSALQDHCPRHPERLLVGHPFHPAHLIPLVEVVPGRRTSADAVAAAMAIYTAIGKRPIHVRSELPGHITNRLQAALWREAYWLIEQGAVSVADLDTAISDGPGLRWSLLGPLATQSLSGGDGGLAHVIAHLGPPMVEWWQTFETPTLDDSLAARLVDGVADELAGVDVAAMVRQRDALLEQIIALKAASDHLPGSSA